MFQHSVNQNSVNQNSVNQNSVNVPFSRDSMKALRAKTVEEERKYKICTIVSQIYNKAIDTAKNTNDLKYCYSLPEARNDGYNNFEFYKTNMSTILEELQSLFPDCSVEYNVFAIARDGKKYNISKMDDTLKSFITNQSKEYIVIDWS